MEFRPPVIESLANLGVSVDESSHLARWVQQHAILTSIQQRSTSRDSRSLREQTTGPILNTQQRVDSDIEEIVARLHGAVLPIAAAYFSPKGPLEVLETRHAAEGQVRFPGDPDGQLHFDLFPTIVAHLGRTTEGGMLRVFRNRGLLSSEQAARVRSTEVMEIPCPDTPSAIVFDGVEWLHQIGAIPARASGERTTVTLSYYQESPHCDPSHPRQVAYDEWLRARN